MKVLIIYNLDPIWENHEIKEVRRSGRMIFQSLKKEGIETYIEEVRNPHLEKILEAYDPSDTIVFNLCETLPGLVSCTEEKIVEFVMPIIEQAANTRFLFTGPHLTFNFNQHSNRIAIFRSIDDLKQMLGIQHETSII